MSLSTAFYTPELTKHVQNLKASSSAFLPYSYKNPVDGNKMWALMVTVPNSGTMLEVHSSKLAQEYHSEFSPIADVATSCPEALYTSQSVDALYDSFSQIRSKSSPPATSSVTR